MKFGLLKDIKPGEYRTIVTPAEVEAIVRDGHEVYVQRGAGAGAGCAFFTGMNSGMCAFALSSVW